MGSGVNEAESEITSKRGQSSKKSSNMDVIVIGGWYDDDMMRMVW